MIQTVKVKMRLKLKSLLTFLMKKTIRLLIYKISTAAVSLGYPDPPSVLARARSRKKRVWGISSNIPCLAPGMQMQPQILITQSLEPQLLV